MNNRTKVQVLLDHRPTPVVARDLQLPLSEVQRIRHIHGWPSQGRVRSAVRLLLLEIQEESKPFTHQIPCPLCGKAVTLKRLHRHQGTRKCLMAVAMTAANAD